MRPILLDIWQYKIMETILITGGTGLIGKRLSTMLLESGYHVIVLTRNPRNMTAPKNLAYAYWDPSINEIDAAAVRNADHIIHLAGAGVMDKRWNEAYKNMILNSRVDSGKLLVETLKGNRGKVKSLISASAIGWYGADLKGRDAYKETDEASTDFLGKTCDAWEKSVASVSACGIRLCYVRTGIVLSKDGGACNEFIKPMRLGIAGILGSGKQVVSWVHIDDLCRFFIYLIQNQNLYGVYNGVAPFPVSNKELVLAIAKSRNGKLFVPMKIPAFILKIMLGEGSVEVLKSCRVSAQKTMDTGFEFLYPNIEAAARQITARS